MSFGIFKTKCCSPVSLLIVSSPWDEDRHVSSKSVLTADCSAAKIFLLLVLQKVRSGVADNHHFFTLFNRRNVTSDGIVQKLLPKITDNTAQKMGLALWKKKLMCPGVILVQFSLAMPHSSFYNFFLPTTPLSIGNVSEQRAALF